MTASTCCNSSNSSNSNSNSNPNNSKARDATAASAKAASATPPAPSPLDVTHPLEPLTPTEIATAAKIVKQEQKGGGGDDDDDDDAIIGLRFEMIELCEPTNKVGMLLMNNNNNNNNNSNDADRYANVTVYKLGTIGLWSYVVNVTKRTIVESGYAGTARPMIQLEEFTEIERAVLECPDFVEACKKRGIRDMSMVCVDPWSAGNFDVPGEEGRHLAHTFCWLKTSEFDNYYAHPIEGLNAIVDIKNQCVLRVDDYCYSTNDNNQRIRVRPLPEPVPVPMTNSNYETEFMDEPRDDLKPINVVQPEGVSFNIRSNVLEKWHEWSMVIGFNAREGLTLHNIQFSHRPVLHRASISEMVVPYGSPKPAHARKNVFDIGEYGLGKLANSLELGCDCLGSIHYLDGVICDMKGEPYVIKNAICIHEEDYGICWKHWDFRTEHTTMRRHRRLVISSISTVGNYEYASYWYFYIDGTIEFEMKATGIINTVGCIPGEGGKYGTEVMPGVIGQIHQHHFCARLDLAVDGVKNTVVECDTLAEPPEKNPYGNAFYVQETPIQTECGRRRNPDAQRFWKFISNEKTNHMNKPTAYKLEPVNSLAAFNDPNSFSGKRMGFIYNHLWVTPFDPTERFPAGQHMNHSDGSDGVNVWTQKGRNVENEDIVAWHVFGLHHPPRMEDFPVQPVVSTGFKLMPANFFDRNPCLDLPEEKNKASCPAYASTDSSSTDNSTDGSQD